MMPIATLFVGTGLDLAGVSGRTGEMCETSEAQAHGEIVNGWPTFSEAAKDRCLQTIARQTPSYVELVICLEAMRDSQTRQEKDKPAKPTNKL